MSAGAAIRVAPKLREATFDDFDAINALEQEQGLGSRSREAWTRFWLDNPAWQPGMPIGWVLEKSGTIVGTIGTIPLSYRWRGRSLLVAAGRAWAARPEARGIALSLMNEYFSQEGPDLFLNTTVNDNASDPFSLFESLPVPKGDWSQSAYWIADPFAFARAGLRVRGFPRQLTRFAGLAVAARELFRPGFPMPGGLSVERLSAFDERFDAFWERLSSDASVLLAVRDRRTLAWHFAHANIAIYTVNEGDTMLGYAVFRRLDKRKAGLTRYRLADFQTLARPDDCLSAILHRATDDGKREGIAVFENVGLGLQPLIDRTAPYRRNLPAWCYYYRASDPALAGQLADPAAWNPSIYDGNASL